MQKTDDKLHWFVAYVRSCCERKAGELFERLGFESFVPVRKEVHKWSDRRKVIDRVLLPHIVFVRMDEDQRKKSFAQNLYVSGYMSANRPGSELPYKPAVVRDEEMDNFRAFLRDTPERVRFAAEELTPGDRVRIVSGPLEGRECELVSVDGRKCLASRLGLLGTAVVEIETGNLKKIQ